MKNNELFEKLENEIKTLQDQSNGLDQLYRCIGRDVFDDEDREIVKKQQMSTATTKVELEQSLMKKKNIYHTKIKSMELRLQDRQLQLEEFSKQSSLFREFPDVLDFFVRKQHRLNETIASIRQKLVT